MFGRNHQPFRRHQPVIPEIFENRAQASTAEVKYVFFFKFLIVDFSLISSPEQSPIRHRETSVEVADERPPYEPRSPDYVPLHTPTYPMQLVSFYLHVNFVKFEFITDSSTREFSERRTGACS